MSTCCNISRGGGLAAITVGAFTALALTMGAHPGHSDESAELNHPAPAFTLTDHEGNEVSLDQYEDKIVVLEWFNSTCPYVVRLYKDGHMNEIAKKYTDKDVVWLAVNPTPGQGQDHNKKVAGDWKVNHPILVDTDTKVSKTYGAKTTPHMFIIDKEGALVYSGALDDDPNGDKGDDAVNYVSTALDELLAGESVSRQETKPYGCGVKYMN
jgi:peroxiredoxin